MAAITERFDNMSKQLSAYNLNIAYVNGDSATTNMAVTDITTEDEILSAFSSDQSAANDQSPKPITDLTITSDGQVQTAATDTSGLTVVIFWIKKNV